MAEAADRPLRGANAVNEVESAPTRRCPEPEIPHIGVLFVHGVGYQIRGDTFRGSLAPLVRLLRDATDPRGRAADPTEFAALSPDGQPFVEWSVGQGDEVRHWVLTEAYWADAFVAPTLGEMVSWLSANNAAGRVIVRLVKGRLRRRGTPVGGEVVHDTYGEFLLSVGVYALLTVYQLLRPLAALIPPVRDATVGRIDRAMLEWAGDMRVMLEDEVQAAFIRQRVANAADVLKTHGCAEIVVVAHSGGAVASLMTLNDANYDLPTVRRFITLGQGLGVAWRILGTHGKVFTEDAVRSAGLVVKPTPDGLVWDDYWASHDLVPDGPFVSPPLGIPAPTARSQRSHRVNNTWQYASDHGSYFANDEEFLVPLTTMISEASGASPALFSGEEDKRVVHEGRKSRMTRVAARSIWGNLVWGAALLAIVGALATGLYRFWNGTAESLVRPLNELTVVLFEAWHAIPGTDFLTSPFRILRDYEMWPIQLIGYLAWIAVLVSLVALHNVPWRRWSSAAVRDSRLWPFAMAAKGQELTLKVVTAVLAAPTLFVIGLNSGSSKIWQRIYENTPLGEPIRELLGPVLGAAAGNFITFVVFVVLFAILAWLIYTIWAFVRSVFPSSRDDDLVAGALVAVGAFLVVAAAAYTMVVSPEFLRYFVGWVLILAGFAVVGRIGYWRWSRWDDQERRGFRRKLAGDLLPQRTERRMGRRVDFTVFALLTVGVINLAAAVALRPISDGIGLALVGFAAVTVFGAVVVGMLQDLINERSWPLRELVDYNPIPD